MPRHLEPRTAPRRIAQIADCLAVRVHVVKLLARAPGHPQPRAASSANPRDLDLRSNIAIVAALGSDPQAYAIARAAAFAPDATHAHRRNLVLVGGMTGQDRPAREDGLQLGLDAQEITDILAVGRRARSQGMSAFGVLAGA